MSFAKNYKALMSVSIPIVGTMLSGLIMMLIDRICLARYSQETLIASGPAIYTAMGILAFFTATMNLTRTFVGQANGGGNLDKVQNNARVGFIAALIMGFILLALQPLIIMIPELSSRPDNIKLLEIEFLKIIPFYGFFSILNTTFASVFIGVLRTKMSMMVGVIGHILDGFFSVGLVFGYFGLPELGMAGSSGGTLVSAFICTGIYGYFIYKSKLIPLANIRSWIVSAKIELKHFFKVGLLAGLGASAEIFANTAFIWIVGGISVSSMLALNIAVAINYVAIIPIIGLGIGASALIANKIGQGTEAEANQFLKSAISLAMLYVIGIGILQFFFPRVFAYPFITDEISEADKLLTDSLVQVLWVYALAFCISMIFAGALEAKRLTKICFARTLDNLMVYKYPYIVLDIFNLYRRLH